MPLRSVAVLSLHTSPVAQPGVGDGGGMNIYVRSLSSALARAGVACDVYTRAEHPGQPRVVTVEPNFRVFNIPAGPAAPVPKESLPGLVDQFTQSMPGPIRACGRDYEGLHAHYWRPGPGSATPVDGYSCSWGGSSPSRASTWPCRPWPRSMTPCCGRWAARAGPTGPASSSGC